MNQTVRVHSIEALAELRSAIERFIEDTQNILQSTEQEIIRTKDFLDDQKKHWRYKEERYKEEVLNAKRALECCQDNDDYSCSNEEEEFAQAKWHLRKAQSELQETQKRYRALEKVEQDYICQVRKLKRLIDDDLQKGSIFLNSVITTLNEL